MRVGSARYRGAIGAVLISFATLGARADELKCEGPFARDSDHSRLVAAFGQSNVKKDVMYQEGEPSNASIVFPKDDARRVEIFWWNEKARKRPSSIQAGGDWLGPKGVRVGMTLAEVEALNGRPFTLYGFGWDFGGASSDWKGGALDNLPGGCKLIVGFEEDENSDEDASRKVAGDHEFTSNQNEMKAVKPKVGTIGLSYPR